MLSLKSLSQKGSVLGVLAISTCLLCSSFTTNVINSNALIVVNHTESQQQSDDDVYLYVENPPRFPGGNTALVNFINRNLQYPQRALEKNTQGRVSVSFVVRKDGTLTDIRVIKKLKDGLSEEAVRIIKAMPRWTPAVHYGKRVNAKYTLPIDFKLKMS
ncbi:energy transducer TonB [Solitalea lacus]|uniref:energy transducer TonB n=1 Tax=Solitalea lacus TaxID=2911172 RepID=UPI001ED9F9F9|nr:energy transducer TonB [Solitalea lacus]UKJ08061.1 energy transducer TonB [Solitalea lacus]